MQRYFADYTTKIIGETLLFQMSSYCVMKVAVLHLRLSLSSRFQETTESLFYIFWRKIGVWDCICVYTPNSWSGEGGWSHWYVGIKNSRVSKSHHDVQVKWIKLATNGSY